MLKIYNKRGKQKTYKDLGLFNMTMIKKLNLSDEEVEARFKKIGYQQHHFQGYEYFIYEDVDNKISKDDLDYLSKGGK